jgi:DNA-binding transcriptional MerR regulator
MKLFSIQSVSEMTNLSTHCIRAWEKLYKAITPVRGENGRRVYSEKEVNRLVLLGKLSSGNSEKNDWWKFRYCSEKKSRFT